LDVVGELTREEFLLECHYFGTCIENFLNKGRKLLILFEEASVSCRIKLTVRLSLALEGG
jgi:hypothetical protein